MLSTLIVAQAPDHESVHWPGFLGGGATISNAAALPLNWTPESIAWKQELDGYGQSSPVTWGGRVFVTSIAGKQKESLIVACHDMESGKAIWQHTADSTFPEKNTVYISRAAPTPVVDGQGIYAYFESGDVLALSLDGKPRWAASLSTKYDKPTNEFGLSASPVQTAELVILLIDDPGASYLVALRKKDGSVAWKTDRTARTSWSSPGLVKVNDVTHVVCSSDGSVDGYDAATGKQLWSYSEVGGNTATTPMDLGDGKFLIAASPGRRSENAALAKKSNGLMQVQQADDGTWSVKMAWTASGATPSWASPILHDGYAYWINRVGAVFCIDATSGDTAYTGRVKESAWATPIAVDDRIYVFGKSGACSVLAAGKELKVLAENQLWASDAPPVNKLPESKETDPNRQRGQAMFSQPVLYGAAPTSDGFIFRTGSMLFCVRK